MSRVYETETGKINTVKGRKVLFNGNPLKEEREIKKCLALLKPAYKVNLGGILSTMQTLPADRQRRLFEQLKPIITNDNNLQNERVQEEANRNINANSTVADLLARLWDASKNT